MNSISQNSTLNVPKWIIIYYILCTLLTIFMMKPNVEYSSIIRFGYMILIYAPLFKYKTLVPFVINGFYWISFCSFTGLLPFSIIYTVLTVAVLYMISVNNKKKTVPSIYLIFAAYFFFISLLHWDFEETGVLWGGILIVFMLSGFLNDEDSLNLFSYSFVLISLVLSTVFLLNYQEFMNSYIRGVVAMERSGWMNPNMLGASIGCGLVFALSNFLKVIKSSKLLSLVLLIVIGISFVSLVLLASRGALLSALGACLFIIFLQRSIPLKYKLLAVLFLLGIVYYSYISGYFELLEFRTQTEGSTESGGNRIPIWTSKFNAFGNLDSFSTLFGIGQLDTISLGSHKIRTHNDFVTALIAYGYVGLFLFGILLARLIARSVKFKVFAQTLPFFTLLLIESNVLEPIFRGYLLFLMLFLYIAISISLSRCSQENLTSCSSFKNKRLCLSK